MENSVQVPKFDGKNFASWKFRIVSILEGKELDDLLEGDPPEDEVKFKEWKKKDAQAKEETIPETSEEVENHDDHSHSDLENQDGHSELPYNLRPNLKDKLYYELSSDDEPIEDNEDKDPTYDPAVGALKLSHGNLLPSSYEEAINHPDSPLWQQAMDKEIHSLQNHHVWDLTELPEGAKAIKSKWIFSKKMDPQANQEIYKARLVALGCSHEYGTDYTETFSPHTVMKTDSFRTFLAYATMAGYEFHHFDVETAFLYGKLSETIYMTQPPGYQDDKKKTSVCILNQALYGLKQSGRVWFEIPGPYFRVEVYPNLVSAPMIAAVTTLVARILERKIQVDQISAEPWTVPAFSLIWVEDSNCQGVRILMNLPFYSKQHPIFLYKSPFQGFPPENIPTLEDEQLDNHVLSDVDIEEPASDTMINRQTESSGSDRPQRTRTIPKRFDDYVLATTNETIPKDYDEAIACEDKKHWENAMLEKIQNMYSHQVWELVPRPVNANVVKNKWVFKISKDQESKTYKARLVAMGYNQIPGRDYNESFSPVIKNATLRTILSMAATKDSVIKLFDVKAAYLNGNIDNTIFMEQPAGFVQDRNIVCKLNKSIYGLPQSGRSWYEKFSQVLHDCELKKLKSDPCLFKWKNEDKYFYVGIYVDEFITVSDSEDTSNRFINKLRHHLEIKDVTCKSMFLGIKIIQDKEGISLQQSHYVQQILQKYGMENCKEVPTPGSKEINLDNHIEVDNCDQHTYQEALGMLMFLAVNTRPDIAYITSKLSQYSRQPKQMHWTTIKRVMRYLRGTIDLGVKFERGKTGILKSYTDASWSTTHDGKSYGGYVLKLGEATIDWKSSKQPLVALSTMEAEMIAACENCCQIKWIINLLQELEEWNFMEKPTAIYTDSQSLINWISSPKQSSRCRHINRKYHFLRDCYESRDICLLYKPSQDLEVDIFTKDLSRDQMKKHLENLSIVGIKTNDPLFNWFTLRGLTLGGVHRDIMLYVVLHLTSTFGTMTAQRYVFDVLRPVTLPYLQGVPNALYQQDNARPHTARISQQALQDVQMLPWPPYSPDLSPIEHAWDIIGRRLHALPQPRSEDELWQMVEREWRAIPQDAIRTLIDSLPRRVAACIAVRGGPTCY
ncbi:hypothetical protein LAZ67_8003051 [Cordylochernes scorpioides]|uniref:Uncharacterized protein n=1 Tax=Cordylochernes scorpioides TaxID=51811 RepID=A0ABY6KUK3_9ARAC|nr:hypothetical protein LAZ67_8003051 [Cordylochernes scorpioides]